MRKSIAKPSNLGVLGVVGSLFPVNAPTRAKKVEKNNEGEKQNKKDSCLEPDRQKTPKYPQHPQFLALDLETCGEPKIGRKGRITPSDDALDPFKGEL
jgi:hypothetical protein